MGAAGINWCINQVQNAQALNCSVTEDDREKTPCWWKQDLFLKVVITDANQLKKPRFNQRGSTLLARNFDILEQGVHHLGNIYTGVLLCLHNSGLQSDYSVWLCGLWVQFRDRIWGKFSSKNLNQKIWYDRGGIDCSWRFQRKLMFHLPAKFQRSVFSNSIDGSLTAQTLLSQFCLIF